MIIGKVIRGKGFGKSVFGIPTANLDVHMNIDDGVYYGYATLYNIKYKMVMSIGIPPHFPDKRTVEVHILDLPSNISSFYDETITIELDSIHFIRKMEKYNSTEELINAIKKDIDYVRLKLSDD